MALTANVKNVKHKFVNMQKSVTETKKDIELLTLAFL